VSDRSLLRFPCPFPVKVMGPAVPELPGQVMRIVERHAPDTTDDACSRRPSRGGRYVAITVVIQARSQAQLDALYRELTACELVTMVL
jgi:uncharacterized protein